jgi:hypothetical protein
MFNIQAAVHSFLSSSFILLFCLFLKFVEESFQRQSFKILSFSGKNYFDFLFPIAVGKVAALNL